MNPPIGVQEVGSLSLFLYPFLSLLSLSSLSFSFDLEPFSGISDTWQVGILTHCFVLVAVLPWHIGLVGAWQDEGAGQ